MKKSFLSFLFLGALLFESSSLIADAEIEKATEKMSPQDRENFKNTMIAMGGFELVVDSKPLSEKKM